MMSMFVLAVMAMQVSAQAPDGPLGTPAQRAPVPVAPGTQVRDPDGALVGTVVGSTDLAIIIDTGRVRTAFAPSAFSPSPDGLLFAMTKAQVESLVEVQAAERRAAMSPLMKPGSTVLDRNGQPVGAISEVGRDSLVVLIDGKPVRMPIGAVVSRGEALVLGMSLVEIKAALTAVK